MHTSRENIRRRRRGFTLVELLIVVAIIIILIAILLPTMGKFHERVAVTKTQSTMAAIQSGLQTYFNDFNMYPPSNIDLPSSLTYGPSPGITRNRGSVMLAQGLMGYLDSPYDGAGPTNGDPAFGFRTKKGGTGMGRGPTGEVKGPYMSPDTKTFAGTGNDRYFVDAWGHEILYFRSTRAPGTDPARLAALPDPAALPGKIFGSGNITSSNDYYFDTTDCGNVKDDKGNNIPSPVDSSAFLGQLGANFNNTSKQFTNAPGQGNILGATSYLLVSAGPDGRFFKDTAKDKDDTTDNLTMSK